MKFRKWLSNEYENDNLDTQFISPDNELDKLYWHRVLRFSNRSDIKDGDYYVTAALKEDEIYIFGLMPLFQKDFNIITIKADSLDFLNDSVIIEREEYEDRLKEIDASIEKLTNKLNKGT